MYSPSIAFGLSPTHRRIATPILQSGPSALRRNAATRSSPAAVGQKCGWPCSGSGRLAVMGCFVSLCCWRSGTTSVEYGWIPQNTCELRWLSWRRHVSVDVCLVVMYPLTLLHDCYCLVLACRYWSKEPHLVLRYLHLCSHCYWHLPCQLAASYQSPARHMTSSGHTLCHWVRLCTSLNLTCGSKSLTMSASSNSVN